MTLRPRACAAAAAILFLLFAVMWVSGWHYFVLPGVGGFGIDDGTLYIPVLGAIPITQFAVLDNYVDALFLQGSWNLLWPLLAISVLTLFTLPAGQARRAIIAFYLVLLVSQAVIFGFTEHGRWAEDGTAINRLPLQFTPALIFCLILGYQGWKSCSLARADGETAFKHPSWYGWASSSLIGCLLTLGIAVTYLWQTYPPSTGDNFNLDSRIRVVVGSGHNARDGLTVDSYKGGIAIVSSGTTAIKASEQPVLKVRTSGSQQTNIGVFWRTKDGKEGVESRTLGQPGDYILDLSETSAWNGQITELGLIFYDGQSGVPPIVEGMQLEPRRLSSTLERVWTDWIRFEPWSQRSVNALLGGENDQSLPLTVFVAMGLLLTLAASWLLPAGTSQRMRLSTMAIVFAWLVIDGRWLYNQVRQTEATYKYYEGGAEHMDIDVDAKTAEVVRDAQRHLDDKNQDVLVSGNTRNLRFKALRAKYWLLPNPSVTTEGDLDKLPAIEADALLYLNSYVLEPGEEPESIVEIERLGNSVFKKKVRGRALIEGWGYVLK